MNDTSYQKLLVWQKGMEMVDEVYKIINLHLKFEQYSLSSQMIRSSVSIVSNIAEGWGRNSVPEVYKISKYLFCIGLRIRNSVADFTKTIFKY